MFDLKYFQIMGKKRKQFFVSGCDEVGRGPLAGPVVAASASIEVKKFDQDEIENVLGQLKSYGINDSKKLNNTERRKVLTKF